MRKYTTISGDTFDIVAKKELGDEKLAGEIIELNLEYSDIILFQAGVELKIPEKDADKVSENLPPWKQGD